MVQTTSADSTLNPFKMFDINAVGKIEVSWKNPQIQNMATQLHVYIEKNIGGKKLKSQWKISAST